MKTEYIVMTASAKMPGSVMGRYGKVALCEVECGKRPKMISDRARGMVRVVEVWDRLFWGSSDRCAYHRKRIELEHKADELNRKS